MDTPQNNPEGYKKGSLLSIIDGFPKEYVHLSPSLSHPLTTTHNTHNRENRLLIVHGLIDENVHFW